MPPQPGEVILCTLFADVHTYFSPPTTKPPHHRFDKRSYLYLYHDALNRVGRLEVANYAGTPDQDAFMGYLDSSTIEYSYKHPTLFSIRADAVGDPNASESRRAGTSQWLLPAPDPQNLGNYMYAIHTIDVYLWTPEDAGLLLDSLKRVLTEGQLRLFDVPPGLADHRDSMSPVVQQLEKVAISTPNPYQRSGSISTTHTSHSQPAPPANMAAVSPPSQSPVAADGQAPAGAQQPSFTPIAAYNPAAPAAPEPIAHREKTPPPLDAANGTGLGAAERHDGVPQFAAPPLQQSFRPQPGQSLFQGPPSSVPGAIPAGQPQLQRANTSTYGNLPPPPQQSPYGAGLPGPPPQDPNAHLYQPQQDVHPGISRSATYGGYPTYPAQSGFGPQAGTPGVVPSAVPSAPSIPPPQQSPSLYQQQSPPAGAPLPSPQLYSQQLPPPQQQYSQQQYAYGMHEQTNINHAIHQIAYVPEAGSKGAGVPAQAGPGQQAATGWVEAQLNRTGRIESQYGGQAAQAEAQVAGKTKKLEKRINKLFKRLDDGV